MIHGLSHTHTVGAHSPKMVALIEAIVIYCPMMLHSYKVMLLSLVALSLQIVGTDNPIINVDQLF